MKSSDGRQFDVVVVGTGIAGCAAMAAAVQSGLSVAVVERASREEYGGNTRYTDGNMYMKNENEVNDDFEESFSANAGYNLDPNLLTAIASPYRDWPAMVKAHPLPDPELISTFAASAGPTIQWLKAFGIRFDDTRPAHYMQAATPPRIRPIGGGLAMIEALTAYAQKQGAEFFYEHTANKLLLDESGNIAGVIARNGAGFGAHIRGKAVVLACGGFEGNSEMLTHYLGRRAEFIRPVAPGGYYNKGEGIRMALEIGAAPAGDFGSYHGELLDPRSKQYTCVMCHPFGIMVNALGDRFTDEGPPGNINTNYDQTARDIAEQPRGIAYIIYDSRIDDVKNWKMTVRSDHPAIEAATLDALAEKLEIPAESLKRTVADYNAACVQGTFNPHEEDHLATRGLRPPKSNWARPLDRPPFGAYPVFSGNCFTFGGLKIDSRAQVIDNDGRPIAGLYAAGETSGLYHQIYPSATSVLRGAVFGRIAGLAIAEKAVARRSAA